MTSTKRIRVSLACDTCRRKKIKCDGTKPSCSSCKNNNIDCVYTQTEKTPKTARSRRSKYIAEFDLRLSRIENALERMIPSIEMITEVAGMRYSKNKNGTFERKRTYSDSYRSQHSSYIDDSTTSSDGDLNNDPKDGDSDFDSDLSQSENDEDESVNDNGFKGNKSNTDSKREGKSEFSKTDTHISHDKSQDCLFMKIDGTSEKYFGSATPLSVFSPAGLKWISEKIGYKDFGDTKAMFLRLTQGFHDTGNAARNLWLNPVDKPHTITITKDECTSLMNIFLHSPNRYYGVINEKEMIKLIEEFYTEDLSLNPLRYPDLLLFYSILAYCHIVEAPHISTNMTAERLKDISWCAIENAIYYYYRVSVFGVSIMGLRGIIALIAFFHHSANPHCIYSLVATAVRFAHELGLHRRENYSQTETALSETRQGLWQIIYCLDKDVSMRCSRPSFINDADCSVNLFKERDAVNQIGLYQCSDGVERSFRTLYAQLCHISSRVLSKLFNATSIRKSTDKIMEAVSMFDRELLAWKDRLPVDMRPENEFLIKSNHPDSSMMDFSSSKNFQTLMLLFNYHYIMKIVHSMSIHHPTWVRNSHNRKAETKNSPSNSKITESTSNTPATPGSIESAISSSRKSEINPRIYASSSICVHSSRSSIYLLRVYNKEMIRRAWPIAYFAVASFISLFTNCIQNPLEPTVKADLQLMVSVIDFLHKLPNFETSPASAIVSFLKELISFTEKVLERASIKDQSNVDPSNGDKPLNLGQTSSTTFATKIDDKIKDGAVSFVDNSSSMPNLATSGMETSPLKYTSPEIRFNDPNTAPNFPLHQNSQPYFDTNSIPDATPVWQHTLHNGGPWADSQNDNIDNITIINSKPTEINDNNVDPTMTAPNTSNHAYAAGNLEYIFNDIISYQGFYHMPSFFNDAGFNMPFIDDLGNNSSPTFSHPDDIRMNPSIGMF
ncbi:hypothetical protein NADFUDRAFT_48114 [Nadsonia fulvescens var. elongata DSM 6958]|uniref:Zn(2)-C6 fungal-type domain-containing protein n=1 Tax=Nadsonia fulvescens var. elongata DSM 6958 TaxID=857566 RepID=A0A1E3PDA6_9ASCO|nr:hypothetical protein NADFUDRAFT_48114 [Nadsonia fulvescens var. elongata DSM 6958]